MQEKIQSGDFCHLTAVNLMVADWSHNSDHLQQMISSRRRCCLHDFYTFAVLFLASSCTNSAALSRRSAMLGYLIRADS